MLILLARCAQHSNRFVREVAFLSLRAAADQGGLEWPEGAADSRHPSRAFIGKCEQGTEIQTLQVRKQSVRGISTM